MKYRIALITLLILISSCRKETEGANVVDVAVFEELTEETMAVHDRVMPDMSVLMNLSMEINEKLEEEDLEDDVVEALTTAKNQVDQAYADMMSWMKEYTEQFPYEAEPPSTPEVFEEKMDLLQQSHQQILKVKEDTEEAIVNAQTVLATME